MVSFHMNSTSFFARILLVLALLCTACGGPAYIPKTPEIRDPSGTTNGMGRAEPGYIQWLERQSMTYQATDLLRVVSGSNLQWRISGILPHPDTLFRHADVWLTAHPLAILTESKRTVFQQLSGQEFWLPLRKAGIRGVFFSPAGPSGAFWRGNLEDFSDGQDQVGFSFSEASGKDEEYKDLVKAANQNGAITGLEMIASSTGMGPDFFLAARGLRQYPGIYAMVEIPHELWSFLPETEKEWQPAPLERAQIESLAREGMFAPDLIQDAMGLPGGWAATHEVRGLDGNARRFAFRWFGRPWKPVFNWSDPSRAAQRIVSSGIIRGIGELGSALAGFELRPYLGLSPVPNAPAAPEQAVQPMLEAANVMAQETRRYGGWALATDALPMTLLPALWSSGPDFALDSVFSPGAEHALLTGNARLLRASIDAALALGLDIKRLAHTMPGTEGVDYSITDLNARMSAELPSEIRAAFSPILIRAEIAQIPAACALFRHGRLHVTTPALAAMALGCQSMGDITPQYAEKIKKAHQSMIFFKAMQPGLLLLSAYDLCGAMPLTWNTTISSKPAQIPADSSQPPAWSEDSAADPNMPGIDSGAPDIFGATGLSVAASHTDISDHGVARAPTLYYPLDAQSFDPRSLLSGIAPALAVRKQLRVPEGRLAARIKAVGSGVIALAVELPDNNGLLISIINFGQTRRDENLNLKRDLGAAGVAIPGHMAQDLFGFENQDTSTGFLKITLDPWGYKAFLLQQHASGQPGTAQVPSPAKDREAPQTSDTMLSPEEQGKSGAGPGKI